jgi:predicted transcriptional regulator
MNFKKINYIEKAINWIHEKTNEKQFLIFASILVGISSGIAAVILKLFVFGIRHYLVDGFFLKYDFKYLYLILPVIGIGTTVLIVKYFFKNQLNRGNTAILFAIAKKSSFLPFHQMYSHIITSGLTVGFGGSAGLESPIVSTGSAIGSNFARTYKLTYKERTLLLAAGAAGGIAGAFNAPIAGVLFALEVILVDISISAFIPLMIVASISYVIVKRFHPQSLDVRRLKDKGTIVSENKDTSILSKINTKEMIETDFATIHFKATLRDIVETIKHSKRNTFPVVKKNNKLIGVIYLDNIREEMFNAELYDILTAKEVMRKPSMVIDTNDDIFTIMRKFEESGQWNLPVVEKEIYIGFLSKSSILDKYRHELLETV